MNRADRVDQLVVRHALQNVSLRAGFERFVNVFVAVVGRQNYEAQRRMRLANGANSSNAAQAREAQIHQHDVGRMPRADRAGLFSRTRLRDHRHIRL